MDHVLSSIWRLQISSAYRSVSRPVLHPRYPYTARCSFATAPISSSTAGLHTRHYPERERTGASESQPGDKKESRAKRRREASRDGQQPVTPYRHYQPRAKRRSKLDAFQLSEKGHSAPRVVRRDTDEAPLNDKDVLAAEDIDAEPAPDRNGWDYWRKHKAAMKRKLQGQTWAPTRKKLSPDTMDGIRAMHRAYPDTLTTPVLAKHFEVSPEAMRRILRSKWQPTDAEDQKRRERWELRGKEVWERLQRDKGFKPPQKWRATLAEEPEKTWGQKGVAAGAKLARLRELDGRKSGKRPSSQKPKESSGLDSQWWKDNVAPAITPNTIPEL